MVVSLLLVPFAATAQSTISGLVRDTSGAVLPGVSVEASSPVLIEKTRSVVTDEQGRYSIVDLRPGTYQSRLHAAGVFDAAARRASSSRPISTRR